MGTCLRELQSSDLNTDLVLFTSPLITSLGPLCVPLQMPSYTWVSCPPGPGKKAHGQAVTAQRVLSLWDLPLAATERSPPLCPDYITQHTLDAYKALWSLESTFAQDTG